MNRSLERADNLARQFAGKVIAWDDWDPALTLPDVITLQRFRRRACTNARAPRKSHGRPRQSPALRDLGIQSARDNILDPAAASLYNFYLYNIDDLRRSFSRIALRAKAKSRALDGIQSDDTFEILTWQTSVELIGVVESLRHKLKADRAEFVRERAERVNGLTVEQREQVEALIDDLLEKMLLDPARRLQGEKDLRRKIQQVEAIRELFSRTEGTNP